MVKINKNDDKNGGKDDFKDDIYNLENFCEFLRFFKLFFESEKCEKRGKKD